jgi:glycosyltransferase involved in cell wall biosynthesis
MPTKRQLNYIKIKIKSSEMKRIRIAIIGSRGIPANYGGFETFAEKLSLGLVERGHEVTVYCAASYSMTPVKTYRQVRRVIVPNVTMKSLDKISNAFLSCIHAAFSKYDLILFLGVSPVLFAWLPRMLGKKLIINIDGLEWKRQKWNRYSASYLKFSESLSGRLCHEVVADSKIIRSYFKEEYGKESVYIAYGADVGRYSDDGTLRKYGLEKNKYLLQVCRLEPENNAHLVIGEYKRVATDFPLVILGDAPHSDEYKVKLKDLADPRVKFLGGVYGSEYNIIRSNPYCYIHGHEVGGTNPALLEALAAGNCVAVLDVPYNLEVIGTAGLSFSRGAGSLSSVLEALLQNPQRIATYRERAVDQIKNHYTWDFIISEYENLFLGCLK